MPRPKRSNRALTLSRSSPLQERTGGDIEIAENNAHASDQANLSLPFSVQTPALIRDDRGGVIGDGLVSEQLEVLPPSTQPQQYINNNDVSSESNLSQRDSALNQSFITQVQTSPQVHDDEHEISGNNLQEQVNSLKQQLFDVQRQMQSDSQILLSDTQFQKTFDDLEQLKNNILNHEQSGQNYFSELLKVIISLQTSCETYRSVVQRVLKLPFEQESYELEVNNIVYKVTQLTNNISFRVQNTMLHGSNIQFKCTQAVLAFKQFRAQSYETLNALKQKYFFVMADEHFKEGTSQDKTVQSKQLHVTFEQQPTISAQNNPLFEGFQEDKFQNKPIQSSGYGVNNQFQKLSLSQGQGQNLQRQQFVSSNQYKPQPHFPNFYENNHANLQNMRQPYKNFVKSMPESNNNDNELQGVGNPEHFENDIISPQNSQHNYVKASQGRPVKHVSGHDVSVNSVKQLAPPRFDKYTGESNAKHWLIRFERTCKRYDFSDSEKLDEVLNQLSKNADRWAIRNFEYFADFETFKKMFLKRFSTPYEVFQHQLLSEKQQRGETYVQFLEKLNNVAAQGDVNEQTMKVIFHNNIYRRDVAFNLDRFLLDPDIDSMELCRQAQIIQNSLEAISQQQKYISNSQKNNSNSSSSNNKNYRSQNNRGNISSYNNNNNSNKYQNQNSGYNRNNNNYQNKNNNNYQNKNKPPYQNKDKPRMAYQQPIETQLETVVEEQTNEEPSVEEEGSEIYDQEQQPSEDENCEQEQSEPEFQPGLNSLVKFDQMTSFDFDPLRTPQKFLKKKDQNKLFLSQVETPKPSKETKVSQYFDVDTFFKNTNVNIKVEDLLLSSPNYFIQFQKYYEKLNKMNNGEYDTSCMQVLNALHPKYVMNKEICQVTVPETKTHLYVKLKIFDKETFCFVDTGANKSCISKDFLSRNQIHDYKKTKQVYSLMNGTTYIPEGYVDLQVEFDPQLTGKIEVAVVTNTQFDFVFGLDLYESFNCYTSRQQLFYKNPYRNRYSSLVMYKTQVKQKIQGFFQTNCSKADSAKQCFSFMAFTLIMHKTGKNFIKDIKNQNMHCGFIFWVFIVLYMYSKKNSLQQRVTCQPVLCNLTLGRTLVNKQKLTANFPKFPIKNKYQLIIVDFPWKYESDKFLKPPYTTMTMKELSKTPLMQISDENCVYLFWTTGPKLNDCFQLIQTFQVKYLTCFSVWRKVDKNKLYSSKGSYTKPNYEYVLLASRGDVTSFKRTKDATVIQEIQAQVQKHSKKPSKFYSVVQKVFKVEKMNCLELFARIQKHSYLDLYGDSVKGYFSPSLKELDKTYLDEKGVSKTFNSLTSLAFDPIQNRIFKYLQYSTKLNSEHLNLLIVPFQNTQYDFELLLPVLRIVSKSLQAFAFNEHEVGTTNVLQHTIELEDNAKLKAQSPYRLTGPERDFVKIEIQHLENLGYIVRDVSPHAAPIVVVRKENGKFRMCIDFRDLNKFTVPHHWPLPQIDVLLTYLHGKAVFSKLDLRSGFFNVSLKPEDQYKTSFVCSYGQYKYTRMPFGLRNAPSTFQHAMEEILRPVLYTFCLVYIDDVIVFSESIQQHYEHLQEVLNLIIQSGVKLHPEKCQIAVPEVEFLGHKVTHNRVYPKESKTAKVETLSPPTTVKQLQSFLGLTSYYRKFIPGYSKVAKPLQVLIQKENKFQWEQPQQSAFETLKRIVTSQPHLKIPNLKSRFYLCTDFSTEGLGAVLSQYDEEQKREKPIEYASRTLNVHEQKYGSYEGECLAVIWAFAKFRHYLLGKEFTLYTDNKALSWILGNKNPSPKIARWLLVIQEYNFQTFHRSGKSNSNADSLSRLAPLLLSQAQQNNQFQLQKFLTFNSFNEVDENQYYETEPLYKPIDIGDLTCQNCNSSSSEAEMLLCESCGKGCHLKCHIPPLKEVPKEHFYCHECMQVFQKQPLNELDITIDEKSQQYLKDSNSLNKLSNTEKIVIKQKTQGYTFENDQLYKEANSKKLFVPTIFQRTQIIEEYHEQLTSHGGLRKTIDLIQNKYYWPRLEKTVLDFINKCVVCIANSKASFKAHNDLHQTQKGNSPFQVWSLDLITGLPETKTKCTIILVIICCFSKWTEAFALTNKDSITIAKMFYENIVCRYGKPQIVRSDQGKEFQGSFQILLDNLGTKHIVTSPYYAKSNGQVERTNRTLIQNLKKTIATKGLPLNAWDVLIPHVLFSLRFCVHKTTQFSPFQILYGKTPNLMSPLDFEQKLDIPPVTQEFLKDYMLKVAKIQKILFPKIQENIDKTEVNSQDYYRTRLKTFQENVQVGQLVFKNVGQRTTKLQLQATGPFRFLKYCNETRTSCDIQDLQTQKIYTVSTANIVPIPAV